MMVENNETMSGYKSAGDYEQSVGWALRCIHVSCDKLWKCENKHVAASAVIGDG